MSDGTESFRNLIKSLSSSIVYEESNVEANRKLWDRYANEWKPEAEFVQKMVENLDLTDSTSAPSHQADKEKELPAQIGDEWSDRKSFLEVVDRFILFRISTDDVVGKICVVCRAKVTFQQFYFKCLWVVDRFILSRISTDDVVGEIGCGGARVAKLTCDKVKALHCFDISSKMIERASKVLADKNNVTFSLLSQPKDGSSPQFPPELHNSFDFLYAFDVLVHVDIHTQFSYFRQIHAMLRDGGHALIHTSNLKAPNGWRRFASQKKFSVAGFCFVTPDMVDLMIEKASLNIVERSTWSDTDNTYLSRDYFVVVRKTAASDSSSG